MKKEMDPVFITMEIINGVICLAFIARLFYVVISWLINLF